MWNKISRLFAKTNPNLNNDNSGVSAAMDQDSDRRMSRPTHDFESKDTYDTRQAKQRASVKWLLSKSYNNKVPENIKEPFYRDHEDQEHLKPQIVHKLANAELYCLGLSNIYSDPNYHNLNHSGIIQTLVRKGVFVSEPPDAQLTETVLIQTTPLKMSAHMAVIEAMMMLYAKEVVTPDRVVAAIQRFTQSPRPEPLPVDYEDALLLWVNKACSALKQKIVQELSSGDELGKENGHLHAPELSPVRELKDLCDGVGLAALVSFYCPEELPWTDLVTGYLPTISDSVHNVLLVYNFCSHSLPCSLFHMMPEDVTYMRGTMKQNLIVFLADLFNVLEIHPVKCVRFPGSEMAFREVSMSKSCPVQTSLPVRKSVSQPPSDVDDEQFVVHHGRAVPTLSSVVQTEEPLVPARLRPAKEKHNQDSKAEERGEPAAAGRPSHWEDARRSSYAGRRSRRNSVTEDSQLTIENFGGSQEHLNFIGRNPDKEVGAHTGRKAPTMDSSSPATPLRTSAQEARSSGVELIFQDTNSFASEKRDEEKTVSSKQMIQHSKQDLYEMDLDLGSKVATSFAELSRLKDSGTYKKSVHTVYMQQDQHPDDEREPPPKTILNKKPVVNSNGSSEKKTTTFAALPNNTTTWQQQSSSNQHQPSEGVAPGEENSQVMASQLLNIRMKLEEKRRRIEGEKRRMEVVMNKQRQKVGKAAFLQAVTKGKNSLVKTLETDTEKDTNCDIVESTSKPLRPFSLQEISEDATSVEHKWLESGVPFIEERKTPDIENMDLEQYQQSISQMNTSLHDIQTDIQRLTSQQNQIQDLTSQHSQMHGFVSQQQQQFQGLANQHQQQLHSLANQQQQIQSLAFQQQQLQSLAAHALVRTQSVDGPSQFYLHDQQTHRRTWAQPSMQTLPHDLAYPHPLPDSRMMWADNHGPQQPTSFNPQPAGFVLHEPKPALYSQHSNSGSDPRYQNGENHQQQKHHSLGAVNHMGTYNKQSANNGTGFQLHPAEQSPKGRGERDGSPAGYSSSPSDYGSRSPPSDSPQHRAPPVPPRHHHHHVDSTPEKTRASTVTHAPMPTPPVDDMEPQSISFIGMPASNSEDPNSSLAQSIKGLQITSGSRTYRIPSPTRPAIARNSFQQQEPLETSTPAPRSADLDDDETAEKGFYISFDNDPQPLRPKPPLRTKRMSPKKERAVSQFESPFSEREEPKSVFGRPASCSDRQESSGYNDRKETSSFKDSRGFNNREETQGFSSVPEPKAFDNRKVQKNNVQSRLDPPTQRVPEPRKVERNVSLNDMPSPGVGLVIGNELLNPEPSTVDEMERKKERIMLLSLQRRQQQEELKQLKEQEAERRREHEKYKQEERERKKEEERERRQIILEQYKLKKATEEAEREGKVLPNKSEYSTMKPVPKMRNKSSAGTRPRPKTIHVDTGGGDAQDGVLSPSRSKKGSTSNLADPVFNSNSRRDYYRGSQDNLADRMEQRRGVGNSLLSRDSPDDGREGSPSRGANQLGRRGSYKTSRDTSEPRRVSGRPKYPSYQGTSNFRGRKSNSLMNLSGSSTDQDSMAYRYGDTDSGLGRATPPRRAPSPGMSSMRHLPSPSGPGSLPPGLMTKRRPFDDGSSDISSNPSSMMEYTGPRLYKQPSSKSNRPIMLNAVEYCVFPGVVNREAKRRVLEEISRSESKHFLILFRDAGCQFRALYSYCPDREEVAKLYGTGPKQVNDRMFDRFFKYNSGGKCFSQIHTKHLTVTIDAFTIHNSLWQGKKDGVNVQLETLLSRQCYLEAKLSSIIKVLPNLQIVHSDAHQLSEMITFTSTLAENVSAKVRQLDEARSRVSECQQRVHDLLDLQLCSQGVQTALRNEDYEKAAAHVHRFLSMDQLLLKQTADDVSEDCTSVTNSFTLLHGAAKQLRTVVTQKFDEAVRAEDLASVERFFKLFPLLGMQSEGLEKFTLYLCSKLQETARKNLRVALDAKPSDKRSSVIYADTLTLLFEGIARVIEIHQPLVETYYGLGRLMSVVTHLQRECDRQSKLILTEFGKHRNLTRKVQQVNELMRGGTNPYGKPQEKIDPKELDLLMGELTIMHARAELYVRFLRRRIMSDLDAGVPIPEKHAVSVSELETMFKNCELCHRMQELLGSYLLLERYFMEESVKKAVLMDTLEEGSSTSSMVDDIFFIVRKCIRRSSSSSSLDGVCAVINNACGLLELDFCDVLRHQLKQGYPSGYLDLTQAYNVLHSSIQQGRLQASDSEQAKSMFLAYLNNADVSTEYIETLKRSLTDEIPAVLTSMTTNERVKLESCLSGLGSVTASLRTVIEYGMQQLRSSAIKPRINPWVDAFLDTAHQLTEEEFSSYESDMPFVQNLIMHLDSFLASFKDNLTPGNYDMLVGILTSEVTTHMEKVIMKSSFNRLGGLVLDKEVRALVSYLAGATSWSIRDKFARLTQMATVLNLERVSEISDYCGSTSGPFTWRLTPTEVRQIMVLRTDFRSEDIKRLKL